jgi:predicted outer membrane lipoprotein
MARFADALESNPAPRLLGDVTLRYEPSMLIGETARGKAGWRSSAVWVVGVALLLFLVGGLILQWDLSLLVGLLVCAAAAIGLAVWLERLEKRQRRFVANFGTVSLRLDFTSPIAGKARTLVVPFDGVKAAALLRQVDGASCLCVDFALEGELLREVLVAHIPEAQLADAERLERVLRGAFGLGAVPADSPIFGVQPGQGEPTIDRQTSSFE